jgi:hypothetical protein
MFRRLFTAPKRLPRDMADEIASLCHADQIDRLVAPRGLLKDVGLDCGCNGPMPATRRKLF